MKLLEFHLMFSDILDKLINSLLPLPAIWTPPGHDFV